MQGFNPVVRSAFSASLESTSGNGQQETPEVRAVLNKLVAPRHNPRMNDDLSKAVLQSPDISILERISDHTSVSVRDAEAMMEMLPDLRLASSILVSLILSPKDLVSTELNYTVEGSDFDHEAAGVLTETIRNYFDNDYRIREDLSKTIQEGLITHGAFPQAILPESSIDQVINSPTRVSVESIADVRNLTMSMSSHQGLLGYGGKQETNLNKSGAASAGVESFGLESFFADKTAVVDNGINVEITIPDSSDPKKTKSETLDLGVNVYDNHEILKAPALAERMRRERLADIQNKSKVFRPLGAKTVSVESEEGSAGVKYEQTRPLYQKRNYKYAETVALNPASNIKRATIGHPLVMKFPAESVIPIHVPGDPSNHLAYFVVLDESGHPVSQLSDDERYSNLMAASQINQNMASSLLQTSRNRMQGLNPEGINQTDVDEMSRIYGDLLERDLLVRLKNGLYGKGASIATQPELYRVMLLRALQHQRTRVICIPAEMMVYMAYDYNRYGVGRSMLSSTGILGSQRAILLFAGTMSSIKNSIGRTVVSINLDPSDQNPAHTVSMIRHEYAKQRQGAVPLRVINPMQISSYLQNAGVEFAVSGNPRYPEMSVGIEDRTSQRVKPDVEFEKYLRDSQIMSLGLTPEMVDNSVQADFAATVLQNNIMTIKRVIQYQATTCLHLTDFIRKYTMASGSLIEDLRQALREHRKNQSDTAVKDAEAKAEIEKETEDAGTTDAGIGAGDDPGTAGEGDPNAGADPGTADPTAAGDEQPNPESDPDASGNAESGEEGGEAEEEAGEGEEEESDSTAEGTFESFSLNASLVEESRRRAEVTKKNIATVSEDADEDMDDDVLIYNFINSVRVSLPEPDTSKLASQMKAYDEYAEHLEKAVKAYVDSEFLADNELGKSAEAIAAATAAIKAHFLRKFLRDNNILPELEELLGSDDSGNPMFELMKVNGDHAAGIRRSIGAYIEAVLKNRAIDDKKLEEIQDAAGSDLGGGGGGDWGNDSGGGDTGGGSDYSDDAGGDDLGGGGGDDLGMGDDLGGEGEGEGEGGEAEAEAEAEPTTDAEADAGADLENYREETGTVTHFGKPHDLSAIFRLVDNAPIMPIGVDKLKWVIGDEVVNQARVDAADLTAPIIAVHDFVDGVKRHIVIDGYHRMTKALQTGVKQLPCKMISAKALATARIQ